MPTTVAELMYKLSKFDEFLPVAIADWMESYAEPSSKQASIVYLRKGKFTLSDGSEDEGDFVCIGQD